MNPATVSARVTILTSLLRHSLTAIGANGIATGEDEATKIAASIITVAGVAWSVAKALRDKKPAAPNASSQ